MSSENNPQNVPPSSSISAASNAPTEVPPITDSSLPTVPASHVPDSTVLPRPVGLIGETLDNRYFVEKELGHGGVGVVYLAHDRRLMDKCVVVKVLLEKWLQDEWVTNKFLHEKEALTRVDHPGIIGILDAGELPDGKPYIVMQCVDGVTLRSVLQPEGIEFERAAILIEQMADALGEAHAKGILHRDLKPENIMLQPLGGGREQVKIIDFGIAKVRDSSLAPSTLVSVPVGTVAYMSPEQLTAERVTTASDIYALSAIASEMLTGRRPFNPESKFQMLEAQRAGVRVKPQDLRPALSKKAQAVILKALSFAPQDRYQDAREFGRELAEALRGEDRTAKIPDDESSIKIPPTRSSGSVRSFHFTPQVIVLLAFLAIGIIGFTMWWLSRLTSNRQNQAQGATSSASASAKSLSYSLLVQKMRDGKIYQEPFESSGQEIFENGYKFVFRVSSSQSGYFYLLNESAPASGTPNFTMLYPTPKKNEGSARLEAGEQVRTGWNVFGGQAGTEKLWVVLADGPVAELAAAREIAFQNEKGALTDAAQARSVREFLTKRAAQGGIEITKDTANRQTVIRGAGDALVYLVELEHR